MNWAERYKIGFSTEMIGTEIVFFSADFLERICQFDIGGTPIPEAIKQITNASPWLHAALKAVEWGQLGAQTCPTCLGTPYSGHHANCQLAKALAKAEGRENQDG